MDNNNDYLNDLKDEGQKEHTSGMNEQEHNAEGCVNGTQNAENTRYSDPVVSEPTVTFDSVSAAERKSTSTGIKVFFAMLSVAVMLIIAVTVGYVFGNKNGERLPGPKGTTSTALSSKGETEPAAVSGVEGVYTSVSPAVVKITVYTDKDGFAASASGVIYSSDGYIVTNDHIYANVASPKFLVLLSDGRELQAEYIAGDTKSDIAVLKIDANGLTTAAFGDSSECAVGEMVVAIGFPLTTSNQSTLTSGIISSDGIRVLNNERYSMKMLQTDTAINPGNSGGALVNMYSQVIGITTSKISASGYENIGYAIPSATVVRIADSLINNGYVAGRGKIGISYTFIDTVQSENKGVPKGLYVSEISTDSDLIDKNIGKGDIITHINDVEITSGDIALDIIENIEPGKAITFTVYHTASKSTETIYASLIPDQGSSSYTEKVDGGTDSSGGLQQLPFGDESSDSYSDH